MARLLLAGAVLLLIVACASTTENDSASVRFYIDAPFCSSVLPMELSIDHAVVAVDTFRVRVANPHDTTRVFVVSPGTHVLGARYFTTIYPEKTVLFAPGQSVLDSLPFYCS